MLLCPKCQSPERRFEVERSIRSAVTIAQALDGNYIEASEFVHDQMWHRVLCLACYREVGEDKARDCFDTHPKEETRTA